MAMKGMDPSVEADPNGGIVAEINITPLTDIFLVLLIIFMVTSSVMSQLGVDVQLPKAAPSAASAQPGGAILTILPDGGMKLNDQPIKAGDWTTLEAGLRQALAKTETKLVILEGDRRVLLGSAIEIMDRARKAGAEKFAIATAPGSE
jgi:biopolymer transport protein ExbD